ncbi:unnamed protein product [Fraxinus pennsylvanica]|uniref:Uncharacterized protein n=1 Tax=Fraxinus pennsylvanica TaxID=56036 RepID=A0AAD2DS58_9LAMI|nr:unnamed protein product [Fraxinus pennsylvanica]
MISSNEVSSSSVSDFGAILVYKFPPVRTVGELVGGGIDAGRIGGETGAEEVQIAMDNNQTTVLQNFIADAAAPPQTQNAPSTDPGYNSYTSHGLVYSSPPSNPNLSQQTGH